MLFSLSADRYTFAARLGSWEVFITRKAHPAFTSISAEERAIAWGTCRDTAGQFQEAVLEVPFLAFYLTKHEATAAA